MKMVIIICPGGFQDFWSPVVSLCFFKQVGISSVKCSAADSTSVISQGDWNSVRCFDHHFLEIHSIMTIAALCRGGYCGPGSMQLVTGCFFLDQATQIRFCCCCFCWPLCVACKILVPLPMIKPVLLEVEAWITNHWTTREFPRSSYLNETDCTPWSVYFSNYEQIVHSIYWFHFIKPSGANRSMLISVFITAIENVRFPSPWQ